MEDLVERLVPATPLAAIQRAWPGAAGAFAKHATPVTERGGVVTVACDSAVWAQELDLMSADVIEGLNGALGRDLVRSLRCTATGGGIRP
jgi:predicted nucleic acid-binding Zn ribbon protein